MYPHRDDFMEVVSDYIDFSQNSELREEVKKVMGIGQIMLETGIEQGIEVFILDNEEEGIPRERVIEKLQKDSSLLRTGQCISTTGLLPETSLLCKME